jgi:hypothetical protein
LRWGLIGLAGLVTLLAIWVTEENWRGKRDWEDYRQKWEARGEKFDWQAFVPPPVPDSQNFFKAPFFATLATNDSALSLSGANGAYPDLRSGSGDWLRGTFTNLKAWQTFFRDATNANGALAFPVSTQPRTPAADVLRALSKYDSELAELRQAAQRPAANMPVDYASGFNAVSPLLKYLTDTKRCSQFLELRAVAELAGNQGSNALADVKLLLHVDNAIRNSPFLISHLVRIAVTSIAMQPIWEGLAEHRWTDDHLASLEAKLGSLKFLEDYQFAMRGERAFAIESFENQRRTRELVMPVTKGLIVTNHLYLMPAAYFYQNELAFAQMHQRWILPLVDVAKHEVSPGKLRAAETALHKEMSSFSPYKAQALLLFPALGKVVKKFAIVQSDVDLARVACALERYRLAHGGYPDTLEVLAPQFMADVPHDLINGQPLHYRRLNADHFVLYSVGWNEKDDGGQVVFRKGGAVDWDRGDWVWQYP